MKNQHLDSRDQAIAAQRAIAFQSHTSPTVGDFVYFTDGVIRRIAHVWYKEKIQTTDNGSFHLGDGYTNCSGSLYRSIPIASLKLQPELKDGVFWFFHHDYPMADNAVWLSIPCRVWSCSKTSEKY